MADIVRRSEKALEVKREYAEVANRLARTMTRVDDLKERKKEIVETMRRRNQKELEELKGIAAELKARGQEVSEIVGAIKVVTKLLKKLDVDTPSTRIDRMEEVKQLVAAN